MSHQECNTTRYHWTAVVFGNQTQEKLHQMKPKFGPVLYQNSAVNVTPKRLQILALLFTNGLKGKCFSLLP